MMTLLGYPVSPEGLDNLKWAAALLLTAGVLFTAAAFLARGK